MNSYRKELCDLFSSSYFVILLSVFGKLKEWFRSLDTSSVNYCEYKLINIARSIVCLRYSDQYRWRNLFPSSN